MYNNKIYKILMLLLISPQKSNLAKQLGSLDFCKTIKNIKTISIRFIKLSSALQIKVKWILIKILTISKKIKNIHLNRVLLMTN